MLFVMIIKTVDIKSIEIAQALKLLMHSFRSKRFVFLIYFILFWNFFLGMFAMMKGVLWSLLVRHGRRLEVMNLFSGRFVIK